MKRCYCLCPNTLTMKDLVLIHTKFFEQPSLHPSWLHLLQSCVSQVHGDRIICQRMRALKNRGSCYKFDIGVLVSQTLTCKPGKGLCLHQLRPLECASSYAK